MNTQLKFVKLSVFLNFLRPYSCDRGEVKEERHIMFLVASNMITRVTF